jgi:hypothetical protein
LGHENHFYVGAVLLVAYLAVEPSILFRSLVLAFLTLLWLNLSGFYGFGPDWPSVLGGVGSYVTEYRANQGLAQAVVTLCVLVWIPIVARLSGAYGALTAL